MDTLIKRWVSINHPYLDYHSHTYLTTSKIRVICTHVDNTNTRHGHGAAQIIDTTFDINAWELYE